MMNKTRLEAFLSSNDTEYQKVKKMIFKRKLNTFNNVVGVIR